MEHYTALPIIPVIAEGCWAAGSPRPGASLCRRVWGRWWWTRRRRRLCMSEAVPAALTIHRKNTIHHLWYPVYILWPFIICDFVLFLLHLLIFSIRLIWVLKWNNDIFPKFLFCYDLYQDKTVAVSESTQQLTMIHTDVSSSTFTQAEIKAHSFVIHICKFTFYGVECNELCKLSWH